MRQRIRFCATPAGRVSYSVRGAGPVLLCDTQLGKAAGARVIATAGTDKKVAFCLSLGADAAFNYREQDFAVAVKELTGGRGADVILDPVGGDGRFLRQTIPCSSSAVYSSRATAINRPRSRLRSKYGSRR